MRIPWTALENDARRRLALKLKPLSRLVARSIGAADALLRLRRARGLSEVSEVRASLFAQLVMSVRAVSVLAERGYPLQAMSQLASIYELAIALAYAGRNAERASSWILHDQDKESFPSSKQRKAAVRELLLAGGFDEATVQPAVDVWEDRYKAYCMAKHGNPKVLKSYGVRRTQRSFAVALGPLAGGPYTQLSQVVLLRACQLLVMAATVYGYRESMEEGAELPSPVGRRVFGVAKAVAEASRGLDGEMNNRGDG